MKLATDFMENFKASGNFNIAGLSVPVDSAKQNGYFQKSNTFAIDKFDLTASESVLVLRFRRGVGGDAERIDKDRTPSPYFDDISLELGSRSNTNLAVPDADVLLNAIELVQKHVIMPHLQVEGSANTEIEDALGEQFARMNALFSELTDRAHRRLLELDEIHAQRLTSISDKERSQEEALTARSAELENSYLEKSSELRRREEDLNNRAHMHARRTLGQKITTDIQQRLSQAIVPLGTSALRWGVFALTLAGGAFLAWLAWFSLSEFAQLVAAPDSKTPAIASISDPSAIFLLVRGALAAFGAVAFLLYAITWLKAMYQDDLRAQRELERYSIDLNRASWAIETIMEAKNVGAEIPAALVNGVTKNLFDQHHGTGKERGASGDALANLLRASASAKFGTNGAEFTVNRGGTNKLAAALNEEE
ncbi:hypothetical protein [Rhizobium etli]|uniref:hypothetical protein n=1 Tax=Rhizobium etli TaxID=29449 RepID=UPI0004266350|nr:hypothetical protein [Rhizobium etli]